MHGCIEGNRLGIVKRIGVQRYLYYGTDVKLYEIKMRERNELNEIIRIKNCGQ